MASDNLESNNEDIGSSPHTPYSPQCTSNFHLLDNSASSNSNVRDNNSSSQLQRASDLLMAVSVVPEDQQLRIVEVVHAAMDELTKVALDGDPLWKPQEDEDQAESYYTLMDIMKMVEVGETHCSDLLDLEIDNTKSSSDNQNQTNFCPKDKQQEQHHLQTEFSRQTAYVRMEPLRIVGFLMDLEQWSLVFSDIVARAAILQTWSSMGPIGGNYNETVQVMTAEFQIPSPLVETRESFFGRFCKQLAPYTWGIVDVSLEDLFPYLLPIGFRRKPSGCLIQASPNGLSKVIWIEHVEIDQRMVNKMYEAYINSGLAFGAKRWVSSLVRHCTWEDTLMAKSCSTLNGVLLLQAGRLSVLKLAERMTKSFYRNMSTCKENPWIKIPFPGHEDIRVMVTPNPKDDPGRPPCTSVVFSTSVHVPTNPKHLFHYLRHEKSRNKWDILSYGHVITELSCIINGIDSRNRVSIIQVNSAPRRIEIFYLQESFYDASGSYIVFAPVDIYAMAVVLRGGNPDYVAILPSGFAVLPDKPRMNGEEDVADGSILTVALNIIDHSVTERVPFQSMVSMHRIMTETVASIKEAFKIQQF
ncbi:homeobox-leucine zipper protein PROTODERMAL FACTOR 2-like [Benincasa hispida]|uniref:homeobox-leucine zipper protein PROTODERMAL FACTOR 2-like n=1 Tax=Benincasa hispida TaxID=102211 RepID=UPI0019007F49|nr:homeobox-leucine zipper protein PROTODERMAL FACTOR 2-like [Benincasa hispida]